MVRGVIEMLHLDFTRDCSCEKLPIVAKRVEQAGMTSCTRFLTDSAPVEVATSRRFLRLWLCLKQLLQQRVEVETHATLIANHVGHLCGEALL